MEIMILSHNAQSFKLIGDYCRVANIKVSVFDDYEKVITNANKDAVIMIDEDYDSGSIYQIVEVLSKNLDLPMVMVSNKNDFNLEGQAFDAGCVDYIKNPYSIEVLIKRFKSHLNVRSSNKTNLKNITIAPGYNLSIDKHVVEHDNKEIKLTSKQFEILRYLALNADRVVTREELKEQIWSVGIESDVRLVDTHVKNIRKKIPQVNLETVNGFGYRYKL